MKLTNKNLLIIFGVLLAIYGLSQLLSNRERSYKAELFTVDSAKISYIIITPKADEAKKLVLTKAAGVWQVEQGATKAKADQEAVIGVIKQLQEIKPKRIASKSKDKWENLELTDSTGTRVQVFHGKKIVADFMVGKFSFSQQTRAASSFIRLYDNVESFAVDGILSMAFNREFNLWRDKTLTDFRKEDVTEMSFQYPADSGFVVKKEGSKWMADGKSVDSSKVADYLSTIFKETGFDFVEGFSADATPLKQLDIKGNNGLAVTLKAFGSEEGTYIINSSQNPKVYFSSDAVGLHSRIFIPKRNLTQK